MEQLIERIEKQDTLIKILTDNNNKMNKRIKKLSKIIDHNTDILNKDLTTLEENVEDLKNNILNSDIKIGNKRSRQDTEN
jgi:hypothetical protein